MQPVAQGNRTRDRPRRQALRDNCRLFRRAPAAPPWRSRQNLNPPETVPINWQITWQTSLPASSKRGRIIRSPSAPAICEQRLAYDGLPQALDGALRRLAQQRLVFGEGLLDWVQIGAVRRQVDELRPSGGDRLCNAGHFVAAQIIEKDNVAGRQCRRQHLLDVSAKTLAVEGALEHIGHADAGR